MKRKAVLCAIKERLARLPLLCSSMFPTEDKVICDAACFSGESLLTRTEDHSPHAPPGQRSKLRHAVFPHQTLSDTLTFLCQDLLKLLDVFFFTAVYVYAKPQEAD